MVVRLVVPGVTSVAIPEYPDHVSVWKSYKDPVPRWYKMFSSMQYDIRQVHQPPTGAGEHALPNPWVYRLTPVVGRPVYTFDGMESFIDASKTFTVDLFTKNFTRGVAQYRVHIGPPREHLIYRLPPSWTWNDDTKPGELS